MALRHLTEDEKEELKEQFSTIDKDESGFIELGELKEALDLAGFKVPGWRVRDMIDKYAFLLLTLKSYNCVIQVRQGETPRAHRRTEETFLH